MLFRTVLILALVVVLARAIWRLLSGIVQGAAQPGPRDATPSVRLVRDPVCGTFVVPGKAVTLVARGETHYFCSEQCRAAFGGGARARG